MLYVELGYQQNYIIFALYIFQCIFPTKGPSNVVVMKPANSVLDASTIKWKALSNAVVTSFVIKSQKRQFVAATVIPTGKDYRKSLRMFSDLV